MSICTPNHAQTLLVCATLSFIYTSGCSVIQPRALEPIDWTDKNIERYAVTGNGTWARLRNKPLLIGDYTATPEARSLWSNLPSDSTSELQISLGDENARGHQLRAGTTTRHNESELNFRLSTPSNEIADIRCRELLHIESEETGISRHDGTDTLTVTEVTAYRATLNCRANTHSPSWPNWQLDLDRGEEAPLHGTLTIDNLFFNIAGSQSSSIGQLPQTVSYEIRQGENVLALIDRSGEGQLSVLHPVGEKQQLAFVGAAAVLLLATDPLAQ